MPLPHGVVCGTLMAEAVCLNWRALMARAPESPAVAKMARLGALIKGSPDKPQHYYGEALGRTSRDWTALLKLPRLSEYGVTFPDLERIVAQTRNRNNPIDLTQDEISGLVAARL